MIYNQVSSRKLRRLRKVQLTLMNLDSISQTLRLQKETLIRMSQGLKAKLVMELGLELMAPD